MTKDEAISELIKKVVYLKKKAIPNHFCHYAELYHPNGRCLKEYKCRDDGDCGLCREEYFKEYEKELEKRYLNEVI